MKKRILIILLGLTVFFAVDRLVDFTLYKGLQKYFGLDENPEVMFIGHSQLMLSIDKEQFENEAGKKVAKYCREGVNTSDRLAMVNQVLNSECSDSLKYVLYGVDQFMFNGTGLSSNSYKLFYPFMDDRFINDYIEENADFSDYWIHKLMCTTRYSDALINSSIRGWRGDWSNYKFGNVDVEKVKKDIEDGRQRHIIFDEKLQSDFEETINDLTGKGIKVILVGTPVVDVLNNYEPEKYAEIQQYYRCLDESSDMITYWDLNPKFSNRHELFFDPIHLNQEGQKEVSREISDLFNKYIKE